MSFEFEIPTAWEFSIFFRLSSGDRVVLGGSHYFAFRSCVGSQSDLNYAQAQQELFESQKARIESDFEARAERDRENMRRELSQLKEEFRSEKDEMGEKIKTGEVKQRNDSLLEMLNQVENDMNESCLEDMSLDLADFELIQLVKEANQIAKESSSEGKIIFEVAPGKSNSPVRVIRDSNWSTNWSKETLEQHLADWRTREIDELDISLCSMVMKCSTEWDPIQATG